MNIDEANSEELNSFDALREETASTQPVWAQSRRRRAWARTRDSKPAQVRKDCRCQAKISESE